jgi:predicted class III extradiol MEMO1 family dioxygenase
MKKEIKIKNIKFHNLDLLIKKAAGDLEKIYLVLGWDRTHWKPAEGETLRDKFTSIIEELIELGMRDIESDEIDTTCSSGGVIVFISNYKDDQPELTISADLGSSIDIGRQTNNEK